MLSSAVAGGRPSSRPCSCPCPCRFLSSGTHAFVPQAGPDAFDHVVTETTVGTALLLVDLGLAIHSLDVHRHRVGLEIRAGVGIHMLLDKALCCIERVSLLVEVLQALRHLLWEKLHADRDQHVVAEVLHAHSRTTARSHSA